MTDAVILVVPTALAIGFWLGLFVGLLRMRQVSRRLQAIEAAARLLATTDVLTDPSGYRHRLVGLQDALDSHG